MKMNFNINMMNIFNNSGVSLLSLLNEPILTLKHPHPLIYCYTSSRSKTGTSWTCDNCNCNYFYNSPNSATFYCTFCDFDICQNCMQQLTLYNIKLFNYNSQYSQFLMNMSNPMNQMNHFKWQTRLPYHKHPLTLIQKLNQYYSWKCNICNSMYNNNEQMYYCSLCNFHLCQKCKNNDNSYLDSNQINK